VPRHPPGGLYAAYAGRISPARFSARLSAPTCRSFYFDINGAQAKPASCKRIDCRCQKIIR